MLNCQISIGAVGIFIFTIVFYCGMMYFKLDNVYKICNNNDKTIKKILISLAKHLKIEINED